MENPATENSITAIFDIMKKMGTGITKTVDKVNILFNKLNHNLTVTEITEMDKIFNDLSASERQEFLSLSKEGSEDKIKEWWGLRCDNQNMIDILFSCTDVLSEVMEAGSDLKSLFNKFGNNKKEEDYLSDIFNVLEKDFMSYKPTDNNNDDINEPNDEKDTKFLSDLGNSVSSAIEHFHDEDVDNVKEKVLNSFSETGVDREYMAKCFDAGLDMGKKVIDLEKEYEIKVDNNDDIKEIDEAVDKFMSDIYYNESDKFDKILSKLEETNNKLDDLSLELELIRSKLPK